MLLHKTFPKLLLLLLLTVAFARVQAQDCFCEDCPIFIPTVATVTSCIDISGLTNGTLGANGQDVCEVSLDFEHSWIGDFEITLFAPDGSFVYLVFNGNPGGPSTNTFWDVTFIPCSETANPDVGYADVFPSQGWADGTFNGSYYPGSGCLEDLTGSANGEWCIEFDDTVGGDDGNIFNWSITFCDGSGTTCGAAACSAEGGELLLTDTQYCEGESIILPTITGQNTDPEYGYSYYIYETALPVGEPNVLLIVDENPDITTLPEGMYVICGFSYLLDDEPLLPLPDGVYDSDDFQADIDAEVFCAEVSTFCTAFFIEPVVAAPDLTFPAEVCVGDPSSIVNNNFDPSVTYQVTINSGGFSAIDLDPEEITFTAQSAIPIEICVTALSFCGNQTTCANIDVLPGGGAPELFFQPTACVGQELTITFTEESGNTYSTYVSEGSVSAISLTPGTITYTPDAAGDLQICLEVDGPCGMDEVCADITVFENPEFVWDGPTEVCAGVEVIYSVLDFDPTLGDYAPSIIQGNFLQFIGIGGGQYAVIWNETSTVGEICMTLTTTGCGDLTQCLTVDIISSDADPMIDGPTATCYGGQYTYTAIDLDGVLSYSWSIDASEDSEIIGSTTDPSVLVSIPANIAASASICLDYTTECGMDQVCIDITPEEDFSNPVNNTPATYCSLSGLLDVSADTDVTGQWTLLSGPGTAIYADATMLVTDVTVTDYGQYTFQFEEPDCGGSIDVTVDFLEVTLPIINGPTEVCPSSTEVYTVSNLTGQTIVGWSVSSTDVLILGTNTSDQVTIEVLSAIASSSFDLCIDVEDACGMSDQICYSVAIISSTIINESDAASCDLDLSLFVTVDGVSGSGSWSVFSGPGTAVFSDPAQSITEATVTTVGDYVFTFVSDECAAEISVPVTVADPITSTDPLVECFGNEFQVSFELSGGLQPYVVNGVSFSGTVYTSVILTGSTFSFTVSDASGCEEITVSGLAGCGCTSFAGTMDADLIEICGDGPATSVVQGDQELDADDNLIYVLHTLSGNILGVVLAENTTGTFEFLPTMTYGVTYYISAVVADADGSSVDFTDDCLNVAIGQPVTFYEEIDISNLSVVVDDDCDATAELAAVVNVGVPGTWSISAEPSPGAGVLSTTSGPETTLSMSTDGTYTVTYEVTNGPCAATSSATITHVSSVAVSAIAYECSPAGDSYQVTIDLSGGQSPYTVDGTPIAGSTFISEAIPSGGSQDFLLGSAADCDPLTVNATFDCALVCVTEAGTMPTDTIEVCGSASVSVTNNQDEVLGIGDSLTYILHTLSGNILGTIIQENGNGFFAFEAGMSYGQTYYLSAVAGNIEADSIDISDPCLSVASGQPIVFTQSPTVDLGPDTIICSLAYEQLAMVSGGGVDLSWEGFSTSGAGGTVVFSNTTSTGATLVFDTASTYTVVATAESSGSACSAEDSVTIAVLEELSIAALSYECSAAGDSFFVALTLAGGVEPYFVDGIEVTGTSYLSETFADSSMQSIVITDSSICGELVVDLSHQCDGCASDPGAMPADTVVVCDGDFLELQTIGAVVGGGDSLVYVLHTGVADEVVDPLIYSPSGIFPFDPTVMSLGVVYYVSAVTFAGGILDLEAACTVPSAGTPVLWAALSTITIEVPTVICGGEDISVTVSYQGSLPAVAVYRDDQGNDYTLTITQTGTQTFEVPFVDTETIELISVLDGNGCLAIVADGITVFEIEVVEPLTATDTVSICNSAPPSSIIDLSTLLSIQSIAGSWQSEVGVLSGSTVDYSGVAAGEYSAIFTASDPAYPCQVEGITVVVIVEDCLCPEVMFETFANLCQGEYTFDLNTYIPTESVGLGSWSVAGGAAVSIGSGATMVIGADALGSYEVVYTLADVPAGCPEEFSFEFAVDMALSAGAAAIDEVEICIGDLTEILLFDYIEGNDLGGQWTTADDLAVDTLTGTVDAAAADGGLYTYTYTVAASGACPASEASVVLLLNDPLELFLSILDPLCFGQADGSVSVQDMDGATVTDFSVVNGEGTPMTPTALMGGDYTLTAVDSNGCIYTEDFTLLDPVELALDLGDDVTLQEGQSAAIIPVTNIGSGDISLYEWFLNQAALDTPTFDTLILSPDGQTFVELIITDDDGCIVADDLLITIIEETVPVVLPNIFNPQTSAFTVPAYEDIVLVGKLAIYDRWGGLVFSATNFDPSIGSVSWDGTYRGQAAATGVYVYALQYMDRQGRQQSIFGDVTLLSN